MDDPEGWNAAQGKQAMLAAGRGDYSLVEARARAGADLTPDELDALARRNRGEKIKTGRKDPAIDFEIWANFVWLFDGQRMTKSTAYSLLAEMTAQRESAIKSKIERIIKAGGLGKNIADLSARRSEPPLLINRDEKFKCKTCKLVACSCDRPQWKDTDAGTTARVLVGFLSPYWTS